MKRLVLSFAFVVAILSPLLIAPTPSYANSSNTCESGDGDCRSLEVVLKLNPGQSLGSVAQVKAVRMTPIGHDDSFSLDPVSGTNNLKYRAGVIDYSGNQAPGVCSASFSASSSDPVARSKRTFTITISGSTQSTSQTVNICGADDPTNFNPAGSTVLKEIAVTPKGVTNTAAGIKGTVKYKDPLSGSINDCGAANQITITGPNNYSQTTNITSNGRNYQSLQNIPTKGTYTVKALCSSIAGTVGSGTGNVTITKTVNIKTLGTYTTLNFDGSEKAVVGGTTTPDPTVTPSPTPGSGTPECDAGPGFSYIVCPIVSAAAGAVTIATNIMQTLLAVQPLSTGSATYKIWLAFRNLADIVFVLVFFVVIFGTSLGLDNYTVKKILPRLIAAVVFVQFSYWIVGFFIDIGNVLGFGIIKLADGTIPQPSFHFDTGSGATAAAVSLAAIAILTPAVWGITFTAVLGALLAIITVVATLLVRQVIVVLLVILSPIAFVSWILPNTENVFKFWYKNLLRIILLFPLVMLLFVAARIFAASTEAVFSAPGSSEVMKNLAPTLAIIAYIIPLFLIPATFKMSGALMGMAGAGVSKLSGAANKRWGKGSESDKARAENRRLNNARRLQNENTSSFGKAVARKRGGFGSMYANVPGLRAIPGVGQSGVQRAAQSKAMADNATQEQSLATSELFSLGIANKADELSKWAQDPSRSANERQAAIDRLVKVGGYDQLHQLRSSGAMNETAWQTAMEKHRRDVRGAGSNANGVAYSDLLLKPGGGSPASSGTPGIVSGGGAGTAGNGATPPVAVTGRAPVIVGGGTPAQPASSSGQAGAAAGAQAPTPGTTVTPATITTSQGVFNQTASGLYTPSTHSQPGTPPTAGGVPLVDPASQQQDEQIGDDRSIT